MKTDERFWAKVDISDECWMWTGARLRDPHGDYGKLGRGGKTWLAHRYSYVLQHGEIPGELPLDHLCRTRLCVRPDHLEPATSKVNILRGYGAGAQATRQSECGQGHPLTRVRDGSRRRCLPCAAAASMRYRGRKADI